MGLSGVSGPFRGAYNHLSFATSSVQALTGGDGASNAVMWTYTVPTGMDIVVWDAQFYAATVGNAGRVNLLAGGASILKNDGNSATAFGVGLTAGRSVTATPSTGVFGTTSTDIVTPVTPSLAAAPRFFGAYVQGGATLSATVSNGASTAISGLQGTISYYVVSHPSILRSAFE